MKVYPTAPEVKAFIEYIKATYDTDVDKIEITKHITDDNTDEWRMFVHSGDLLWVPWVMQTIEQFVPTEAHASKLLVNSRYSIVQTKNKK